MTITQKQYYKYRAYTLNISGTDRLGTNRQTNGLIMNKLY